MSGWRRKVFDAPGLTQAPPGQYLEKVARRWKCKIYVTSSGYDDIGKVLDSMGVAFEPFPGAYDCDLLFVNCGTGDHLNPAALRQALVTTSSPAASARGHGPGPRRRRAAASRRGSVRQARGLFSRAT
jgi:hypothetical protein